LQNKKHEYTTKGATRIETFSDGVFAIAITLLVLELIGVLHSENNSGLVQTCLDHWQSFLAFAIGFITILICWINHHVAFEFITNVDTNLMWINGLLLFVVTLTPFPTAVLAQYLTKESATAFAFFGFNYILISISAYSICAYAYNHRLIKEEDRDYYYGYKLMYRYAIAYNIVAFVLCFFSFVLPVILYTVLFVAFAAPKQFASRLSKRKLSREKRKASRRLIH
jgi:uncharacterized membrane protein